MLYNLLFFLILFIIAFLVFTLFNKRKLKNNKKKIVESNYIINKFKLDPKKVNYVKLLRILNFTNAFILAFVCTVISILPVKFLWQMLIAFVLLFVMIYLFYELIGRYTVKKGWKKEEIKTPKNKKSKK